MRHEGPPPETESPWYPPRSELLAGVEAWWELDELGGGVLVGLYADGSLVFIEGNEPHPGHRRVSAQKTTTASALLETRCAPMRSVDPAFLEGIIRDLEAHLGRDASELSAASPGGQRRS